MSEPVITSIEQQLRQFSGAPVFLCVGELTVVASSYPVETNLMLRALAKRKREFFTGRDLARQAMAKAGAPVEALPRGPLGNPIWPAALIGSITHDQRYAAAVVAHATNLDGLGLDLIEEPNRVDPELTDLIMSTDEQTLLATRYPHLPSVAVAFGLKESVVKAVSVHLGRFLDLLEIHLEASHQGVAARIEGVAFTVPCIVLETEFGLMTSSCFRLKKETTYF